MIIDICGTAGSGVEWSEVKCREVRWSESESESESERPFTATPMLYQSALFQLSNTQIELSACYRDINKLGLASEYPDTERRLVLETVLTRSSNISLWWTCMVTSVSYLVLSIFVRSLVVTSINSLSMSKKYWFLCTMICKEMKKWKKKLTSFNLGNREC